MANPLLALGTLNRLVASVTWQSFSALNVTASFLNSEGIRLALDGEATRFLPAMAGAVTSPEPYQMVTLTINLLKTQGLAGQYKAQMETNTLLGSCVVRPDVQAQVGSLQAGTPLPPYDLTNMAIEGVRELAFSGQDAGYAVVLRGTYYVNLGLWP